MEKKLYIQKGDVHTLANMYKVTYLIPPTHTGVFCVSATDINEAWKEAKQTLKGVWSENVNKDIEIISIWKLLPI